MTSSFADKVFLISGASSGIGEAAAAQLAQRGATVYGLGRRTEALEAARARHSKSRSEIRWLRADVTRPADTAAALRAILDQAGRLDALINNAAVFEFGPLEASSEAMIKTQLDINVVGLIYLTQAALPALTASKGTILNIGSAAGHKPVPGGSIYAATKAAVESLTRSWALELAPKGIRVNAIAPGPTETPGFDKLPIPPEMVPQVKASFVSQVPLGRMASPAEIAHWIVQLVDPSVTWLTGEILAIDGGMSLT